MIPTNLSEKDFNCYILPHLKISKFGPKLKVSPYKIFNYILRVLYTGMQWRALEIDCDEEGKPELSFTNIWRRHKAWYTQGCYDQIWLAQSKLLHEKGLLDLSMLHIDGTKSVAKKGGQSVDYSGHKRIKGSNIVVLCEANGYPIACSEIVGATTADMGLVDPVMESLAYVESELGVSSKGIVNLDSGFDSGANEQLLEEAGYKANIKKNKRNTGKTQAELDVNLDQASYKKRFTIERTFAWEDKFRRLVVRYERLAEMFLAFKMLAFILINSKDLVNKT